MRFVVVVTLCILAGYVAYAGEQFDLKLGRSIKAFDQYELHGASTRISRVQVHDENNTLVEIQADTTIVRISALCRVHNVTVDGQEAVKSVTISYAYAEHNSQTSEILPAGTVLLASFSDTSTAILKDSTPLSAEVMANLVPVIRSEGGKRTGEILDARKKVGVGDIWPINVNAFKKTFDEGGRKRAKGITGKVTFVKIDSGSYMPAAVVEMKATAKNAVGDMGGLTPSSSKLDAEVMLYVPMDQRYPVMRTASLTKVVAYFGKGKGTAVVEFTVTDDLIFER